MNCLNIKKTKFIIRHINSEHTVWRWENYMPHHVSACSGVEWLSTDPL